MWISLKAHCIRSGDSIADVRARLECGSWKEGEHVRSLPNGDLEVCPAAYNAWVELGPSSPLQPKTPPKVKIASPVLATVVVALEAKAAKPKAVKRPHTGGRKAVPTNLYRHYGKDDTLLYVGISLSAVHRLSQHMRSSGWERLIVRIEVQRLPNRVAALVAEREAIRNERPLFNVTHATAEVPEWTRANRGAKVVRNQRPPTPISGPNISPTSDRN